MKRPLHIFPLMAFTALSLTLAGCDDKKTEETANAEQATAQAEIAAPAETAPAPVVTVAVNATNAHAYATAEGATTGAIFVTLNNPNTASDTLVSARTDKSPRTEIHESFVDGADGTMQMRPVQGVEVPPGLPVELKPGGYHIMLFELPAPLVEGETFNATLTFQNAGDVVVPVTVTAPGASATDALGAEMTAPDAAAHDHAHDAPAPAVTDEGVVVDEATPDPTPEEVPADAPVTDEQPAQ